MLQHLSCTVLYLINFRSVSSIKLIVPRMSYRLSKVYTLAFSLVLSGSGFVLPEPDPIHPGGRHTIFPNYD